MSRIRTGHKPGDWRAHDTGASTYDDGFSSPQLGATIKGSLVQGGPMSRPHEDKRTGAHSPKTRTA